MSPVTGNRIKSTGILLLGPPGAGKSTVVSVLRKTEPSLAHFSVRRFFVEEAKKRTTFGQEAKRFVDKAVWLPDSLVCSAIESVLPKLQAARLYIIEGFPATVGQAAWVQDYIKKNRTRLLTIYLEVPDRVCLRRSRKRRRCVHCQDDAHLAFSEHLDCCPNCGLTLKERSDDEITFFKNRLAKHRQVQREIRKQFASPDRVIDATMKRISILNEVTSFLDQVERENLTIDLKPPPLTRRTRKIYHCIELPPDPSATLPGIGHLRSPILSDIRTRFHEQESYIIDRHSFWDLWGISIDRSGRTSGNNCHDIANGYVQTWQVSRNNLNLRETGAQSTSLDRHEIRTVKRIFRLLKDKSDTVRTERRMTWFCQKCHIECTTYEIKQKRHCPVCMDDTNLAFLPTTVTVLDGTTLASSIFESAKKLNWPKQIKQTMVNLSVCASALDMFYESPAEHRLVQEHAGFVVFRRGETFHTTAELHLGPGHPYLVAYARCREVAWKRVERGLLDGANRIPLDMAVVCPISGNKVPVFLSSVVDGAGTFGLWAHAVAESNSSIVHPKYPNRIRASSRTKLQPLRISSSRSWGIAIKTGTTFSENTCQNDSGRNGERNSPRPNAASEDRFHPLFALACHFVENVRRLKLKYRDAVYESETIGACEHAITPMLYARVLGHILNQVDSTNTPEPFMKVLAHGVVKGEDGKPMSRLHNNVVSARDILDNYDSDVIRLAMALCEPPEADLRWNPIVLDTMSRWIRNLNAAHWNEVHDSATSFEIAISLSRIRTLVRESRFHVAVNLLFHIWKSGKLARANRSVAKQYIETLRPFAPIVSKRIVERIT